MDKRDQEIIKKIKEKYKNESPEDRVSRWVLGTIKWHYDFTYIIGSGALDESRAYKKNLKIYQKIHNHNLIQDNFLILQSWIQIKIFQIPIYANYQ